MLSTNSWLIIIDILDLSRKDSAVDTSDDNVSLSGEPADQDSQTYVNDVNVPTTSDECDAETSLNER